MHKLVWKTQKTKFKSERKVRVGVLGQVFAESVKMFVVNWHRRSPTYEIQTNLFNQTPLHYEHGPLLLRETEFI